jgi:hypothetical protein
MDCLLIPGVVGFERHFCLCVCADFADKLGCSEVRIDEQCTVSSRND